MGDIDKRLRVLTYKNDHTSLAIAKSALEAHPFDLAYTHTETPQAFYAALADRSWDLILCPAVSTDRLKEMVRQAKNRAPDAPVVVVEERAHPRMIVQAIKAGATDYVTVEEIDRIGVIVEKMLESTRAEADPPTEELDQLSALSKASQAVTASLELDQVLGEITSLADGSLKADYTGIVLIDDQGQVEQSAENLSGIPALKYRIRSDGLTAWIVESRRPVIINDIQPDGTIPDALGLDAPKRVNPYLVKTDIQSIAGLPLMVKDSLLGVLYLHSTRPDAFHAQLSLLTAFASQVAIAIENARLFQAQKRQARRLSLLADVARIAASTLDGDRLLRLVVATIQNHLSLPLVVVLTLTEERETAVLQGYRATDRRKEPERLGGWQLPCDKSLIGRVIQTNECHAASDVHNDPLLASEGTAVQSAICVPISYKGEVKGVLSIADHQVEQFEQNDQSLLQTVTDTIAVGLRNTQLYSESQRRVQELTLLTNISVQCGASLTPDTLIDKTLRGLKKLTEVDRAYFVTVEESKGTWSIAQNVSLSTTPSSTDLQGTLDQVSVEYSAMARGEPFVIFDAARDPRLSSSREVYTSRGATSVLLVPVMVGERFYGVLGLENCHQKRIWSLEEIQLVEGITNQLGLGLENAHLFRETRRHADDVTAALNQLERMDQVKDEFIQNVSHELRSPLALIRGYAEMLESGELGEIQPEQQKPIAVIARRARMLADLVHDITMVLEAEVKPPEPEPVSLGEMIEAALQDFKVTARQKELRLESKVEPGLPRVLTSPNYLRRVLDNLIGNAIKFTPPGGTISVHTWAADGQIVLEVSDTGIGIPPEKIDHVFERFYQADGSARRRYGGVGLGLALVKEIVEAYGGTVSVESQVGEGTTFTVTLEPV